MIDLYREELLDHFKNPRNFGELPGATVVHEEDNPLCGDRIFLQLKIEKGRVTKAMFKGEGCAFSTAAASMLTEYIKGRSLGELKKLKGVKVLELFNLSGISPARLKCALLSFEGLRRALFKYRKD